MTTVARPALRFEIKYRIHPDLGAEIREWIANMGHLRPDENGEGGTASYNVHSLYLDSREWGIYRDTKAGLFDRYKLRARCYQFTPDAAVFLEVKHRAGEAMWKTRAEVPRSAARELLAGGLPTDLPSTPAVENFRSHMDRRNAYPRVWISYRRHAYVGGTRQLVRVTFDTRIKSAPPTADLSEPPQWFFLPEVAHLDVLELKYSDSYPPWVADMIRRFHLQRWNMSKYKHGVEVIADPVGEAPRGPRLPEARL